MLPISVFARLSLTFGHMDSIRTNEKNGPLMCLLYNGQVLPLTEEQVDEHPASIVSIALNTVLMLSTRDFTRQTEPLYTVSENALFTLYTGRDEMMRYCEFWLVHK